MGKGKGWFYSNPRRVYKFVPSKQFCSSKAIIYIFLYIGGGRKGLVYVHKSLHPFFPSPSINETKKSKMKDIASAIMDGRKPKDGRL